MVCNSLCQCHHKLNLFNNFNNHPSHRCRWYHLPKGQGYETAFQLCILHRLSVNEIRYTWKPLRIHSQISQRSLLSQGCASVLSLRQSRLWDRKGLWRYRQIHRRRSPQLVHHQDSKRLETYWRYPDPWSWGNVPENRRICFKIFLMEQIKVSRM